ncbi:MAG TPA: TraR/DksA C4-type zinc finger protein [Nitrospiria bacterium]|jgi:DnaK suppressor protein|nr:TraR/DksA C4-type zinc finger protein [Nitrospiria bacterium]
MPKDAKTKNDTKKAPKSASSAKERELAEIRQDLETQRKTLLSDAGLLIGQGLNYGAENLPDLGDQASAVTDQNFALRLKEREQRLLKKIDEALDRLTNGTFGVCESCGGEISIKRLKARPVTTLCIECKTKQEEDERVRQ